jgi:cytochrome P450
LTTGLETDDLMASEVPVDPYGYYGRLREADPVHWNPFLKAWLVTRHGDVVSLLRNHAVFSSVIPACDPCDAYPPVDDANRALAGALAMHPLEGYDRPEHQQMRQAIHRWFTPKAVAVWRAHLRAAANDLIDARRADRQIEVKTEFATPLHMMTSCWMFGIARSDLGLLGDLSATVLAAHSAFATAEELQEAVPAWRQLKSYFEALIEGRCSATDSPQDVTSMFLDGERRGVFTRQQCIDMVAHMMLAGYQGTVNLICNGLLALLRSRSQWDLLCSDPAGLCASATEECLRYEPFVALGRVSHQDVELAGKQIRANERILWVMASANRDPRVFSNPEVFDISRSPNPHLTFGGGIHHCLGAALARVEGQEAFRALAERLPELRLRSNDVEWMPNLGSRELRALDVVWS